MRYRPEVIAALTLALAAPAAWADPAMLYWVELNDGVFRCELPACSTFTEVIDDDMAAGVVTLDPAEGRLYYTAVVAPEFTEAIFSATLDGADIQELYRAVGIGGVSINDIAIEPGGNDIYYAITGGPWRIRRIPIPGGGPFGDVLNFLGGGVNQLPGFLNFDTGVTPTKLYWQAPGSPFAIWRADPTEPATNLQQALTATDIDTAFRLDVAGRRAYYAESGTIMRAELPGFTNAQTVVAAGGGFGPGMALDLDTRMVYWSDTLNSEVRRVSMDPPFGTPQTVLFSQSALMRGIAILPGSAARQLTVPALGPPGLAAAVSLLLAAACAVLRRSGDGTSRAA